MRSALRRRIAGLFFRVDPLARPCCSPCAIVTLHFVGAEVFAHPAAEDPEALARALGRIAAVLVENPSAARLLAGCTAERPGA